MKSIQKDVWERGTNYGLRDHPPLAFWTQETWVLHPLLLSLSQALPGYLNTKWQTQTVRAEVKGKAQDPLCSWLRSLRRVWAPGRGPAGALDLAHLPFIPTPPPGRETVSNIFHTSFHIAEPSAWPPVGFQGVC